MLTESVLLFFELLFFTFFAINEDIGDISY